MQYYTKNAIYNRLNKKGKLSLMQIINGVQNTSMFEHNKTHWDFICTT